MSTPRSFSLRVALLTNDNREPHREYHVPNPWFGTAPAALLEGFALLPEVEVHVVSCLQRPVVAPEKLAPNIWYHALHVPKRGWLRTGYQGCIRAVRRKLRELQPDIVHGQGTERDCSISAVFSGFRNVVTLHGNMRRIAEINRARPFSFDWLTARLETFTLPRTDGVFCATQHTWKQASSLARKTWLVPNATGLDGFELNMQPLEPPVVLIAGTLSRLKNQVACLQALDPLARRHQFRVILAGGAQPDGTPEQIAALLGERPWAEYRGLLARPELLKLLAEASVLLLPSLEENCPMVILEAMAAGIPVAAAARGGIPELIEPGVTGLLFDPTSPDSIAGSVEELLADRRLAASLAKSAKVQAIARFHPRSVAARHVEIYRELLGL